MPDKALVIGWSPWDLYLNIHKNVHVRVCDVRLWVMYFLIFVHMYRRDQILLLCAISMVTLYVEYVNATMDREFQTKHGVLYIF